MSRIMPRQRLFTCTRCKNPVTDADMEEILCAMCGTTVRLHRKCGGRCVEYDWMDSCIR